MGAENNGTETNGTVDGLENRLPESAKRPAKKPKPAKKTGGLFSQLWDLARDKGTKNNIVLERNTQEGGTVELAVKAFPGSIDPDSLYEAASVGEAGLSFKGLKGKECGLASVKNATSKLEGDAAADAVERMCNVED
jgi:hypothetical protein